MTGRRGDFRWRQLFQPTQGCVLGRWDGGTTGGGGDKRLKQPSRRRRPATALVEAVAFPVVAAFVKQPPFSEMLAERVKPTDADLASDDALDDWMLNNVYTSHHISSTCKMGPESDPLAAVDQYARARGVSGLRVADASIMPDCIRANTNATSMMIGERAAEFILRGD